MATMADVARRAGVSLSTVSYALSGSRPVSDATRARILEAMEELDYAPNLVARSLKGRRTRIVALLLPTDDSDADPFMADVITAAAEAARQSGYHLLLWTEPFESSTDLQTFVRQGLVDGALLLSVQLEDERVAVLERDEIPLVLIGRTADPESFTFVDTDTEQLTDTAIGHVTELGHRAVAFVGPPPSELERRYGFVERIRAELAEAAARQGVELVTCHPERSPSAGREAIGSLLFDRPDLTAAIVMNDPALAGVIQGAQAEGRRVPEDFSVLGLLASSLVADATTPATTAVVGAPTTIGRLAAQAIVEMLDGGGPSPRRQELVGCELVIRGSMASILRTA
ncbi:MAG: LacI family DNA-binding transcriptional regulator [Actinomycetota bacterium]